jgi:hypothetical protein
MDVQPTESPLTNVDRPASAAAAPAAGVAFDLARSAGAVLSTRKIALGEELPVFCEKCGYALHGLPQVVCGHCAVRQFHCPECGHHQPINTLRPAAQKLIGRIRSFFVAGSVFLKLNFFGWLLFAWAAMGFEFSYEYRYDDGNSARATAALRQGRAMRYSPNRMAPREVDAGQMLAFGTFGIAFGMFGRMLLLRWRRGHMVGLVLSGLVCLAVMIGAMLRKFDREQEVPLPLPFTTDFVVCLGATAVALTLGASVVWGIWVALAHLFLPKTTSRALLEWQRTLSNPSAASLARD